MYHSKRIYTGRAESRNMQAYWKLQTQADIAVPLASLMPIYRQLPALLVSMTGRKAFNASQAAARTATASSD